MATARSVSDEQRRQMISEAAYFLAERRGFHGGDPVADWLRAEAEVSAMLGEAQGIADRLEERLATLNRRLKTARRKLATMKAEAREEWEREVERFSEQRDRLQRRLADFRRRGVEAGEKTREQLEKARAEAADLLRRLEQRLERARE